MIQDDRRRRHRDAEQPPRAAPIAAPGAQVPARQEQGGEDQDRAGDVGRDCATRVSAVTARPATSSRERWVRPGPSRGMRPAFPWWAAASTCSTTSATAGMRPFPRHPLGRERPRNDLRGNRMEGLDVQAGRGEERWPGWCRGGRVRLLSARRHGFERRSACRHRPAPSSSCPATVMGGSKAVGVQLVDTGTSGSGLERCQKSMTGAVRRLSASQRSGAGLVREMCPRTSKLTDRPRYESMPARRIAERHHDVARAILQGIERLLHRHARIQQIAIAGERADQERRDDRGDDRQADGRMHRLGLPRRRDHVGRRRLAGGQRGRERIAARQRRRDRERRRRPILRLRLEAAQNDALRSSDRGRSRSPSAA